MRSTGQKLPPITVCVVIAVFVGYAVGVVIKAVTSLQA